MINNDTKLNNDKLDILRTAYASAKWYPESSERKPKVTVTIDGNIITIEFIAVKRKCYDGLITPTAHYTFNGKRISWKELVNIVSQFQG